MLVLLDEIRRLHVFHYKAFFRYSTDNYSPRTSRIARGWSLRVSSIRSNFLLVERCSLSRGRSVRRWDGTGFTMGVAITKRRCLSKSAAVTIISLLWLWRFLALCSVFSAFYEQDGHDALLSLGQSQSAQVAPLMGQWCLGHHLCYHSLRSWCRRFSSRYCFGLCRYNFEHNTISGASGIMLA